MVLFSDTIMIGKAGGHKQAPCHHFMRLSGRNPCAILEAIIAKRDFRSILRVAVLVPFLFIAAQAAPGAIKPVMVHYMPWFVSRPYSGSWGWHWTMNHFNPS